MDGIRINNRNVRRNQNDKKKHVYDKNDRSKTILKIEDRRLQIDN